MDVSLRSIPIEETRFFQDLYGTFNTQGIKGKGVEVSTYLKDLKRFVTNQ